MKAFQKVWLKPNESKVITIELNVQKAFEFYNDKIDQWVVESGKYTLSIGTSASDIIDQYNVKIEWKWDENERRWAEVFVYVKQD